MEADVRLGVARRLESAPVRGVAEPFRADKGQFQYFNNC
jgi:hypothetical protein